MLFVDTLTIIAAVDGRVSTTELGAIESIVARRGMSVRTEEVDAWVNTAVAWMKAKDVPAFANEVRDRLAPHRGTRFLDDVLEALVEISKHDGAVQENEVRVIDWFRKQFAS